MDFCRNVSVSGEYQQEQVLSPPCSKLGNLASAGTLDDLFSSQNTEVDVSLEWLSIFVEDCLTSTGNCLPAAAPTNAQNASKATPKPSKPLELRQRTHPTPPYLKEIVVPVKARSKRKRTGAVASKTKGNPLTSWSQRLNPRNQNLQLASSDPPLLQQAYWLADSELILPIKPDGDNKSSSNNTVSSEQEDFKVVEEEKMEMGKESLGSLEGGGGQQPRRCTHCLAQRTPQWRAGPLGPKTLCNACGVRYKSGRLLPEYRPAKSPTFVSYLHSNSHKKVMEMRMALVSSVPSEQ